MNKTAAILLALLLIAGLAGTPAAAQEAPIPTLDILDRTGTPTRTFAATVDSGQRDRIEIRLAVDATAPVEVTTAIANVVAPPNGGFGLGPVDAPLTEPATWLDAGTGPLTLDPGTANAVTRTIGIAVPPGTAPGQYVAAFTMTTTGAVPIPGPDSVGQRSRATATIAITVPGRFETGFELGDPTFVGTGATGLIQVPVTNTGTVPVHPRGTLTLESPAGDPIATVSVTMGAVFAGNETVVSIALPAWPPAGDAVVAVELTDPDTRAATRLVDIALTIPEPPPGSRDPEPFEASPEGPDAVSFERLAIDLEGTPLASVTVDVAVANVGNPIPNATLTLEVIRNGQLVDEVAIAGNVALADGVTSFSSAYSPDAGFGSGLVSFRVRLDTIASDGTATLLIRSGTIAKIDIP